MKDKRHAERLRIPLVEIQKVFHQCFDLLLRVLVQVVQSEDYESVFELHLQNRTYEFSAENKELCTVISQCHFMHEQMHGAEMG